MPRHYLDHASTASLRPEAAAAMTEWIELSAQGEVGDPGRIHHEGLVARQVLEDCRASTARLVGARPREVVFTSGATEAINAAVWGVAERGAHQVLTAVEHAAVRLRVEAGGGPATVVAVDRYGQIDPEAVAAAIRPDTAAVHVQWANHEVGTIQPVREVAAICHDRGVLCHVDAAQAVGRVPVDFADCGADLLSFSGHKFGAPVGTGGLVIRQGLRLRPLLVGSDQERARRAGLENIGALVGLGAVADALDPARIEREHATSTRLTADLARICTDIDGVVRYGHPDDRVPHLVCVGVDGVEPQAVLLGLDRFGIAAHSGSACASESLEPSPVLAAMGVDAHRSLRFSVGWSTTDADVAAVGDALPRIVDDLRALARG